MSTTDRFTIGDTRTLDIALTRDGEVVNLDDEEPELRFRAFGTWQNVGYSFSRDNLEGEDAEGGITVVDGPGGVVRVAWDEEQTSEFPALLKSQFMALELELEMTTDDNGVETPPLDVKILKAYGQLIE